MIQPQADSECTGESQSHGITGRETYGIGYKGRRYTMKPSLSYDGSSESLEAATGLLGSDSDSAPARSPCESYPRTPAPAPGSGPSWGVGLKDHQ